MIPDPEFSTPATDRLCRDIARASRGVCLLGFGRGKDALCAWLQLRRHFHRVIPFHCAWLPGLRFCEQALRYYEDAFQTRILRMMDATLQSDLRGLVYQLPCDAPFIAAEPLAPFDKLRVAEYLRHALSLPRAWCAFGINASDSIDRRLNCQKSGGRHPSNRTFYPTFDWPRDKILETVERSGLLLAPEYAMSDTTVEGTPCATYSETLRRLFPADAETLSLWYPLHRAKVHRERLNARVLAALERGDAPW